MDILVSLSFWQCLAWLNNPILKWQCLSQKFHNVVGIYICGASLFLFLWALLSSAAAASSDSPDLRLRRRFLRHFERSAASPPSTQCPCWEPSCLVYRHHGNVIWDVFSQPQVRRRICPSSFGILPSSIRRTCPNQRSLRWRSKVYMEGSPAQDRTTALGILSIKEIPNRRCNDQRWNLLSCFFGRSTSSKPHSHKVGY